MTRLTPFLLLLLVVSLFFLVRQIQDTNVPLDPRFGMFISPNSDGSCEVFTSDNVKFVAKDGTTFSHPSEFSDEVGRTGGMFVMESYLVAVRCLPGNYSVAIHVDENGECTGSYENGLEQTSERLPWDDAVEERSWTIYSSNADSFSINLVCY